MQTWIPGRCNDRSGFLFSHECGGAPAGECGVCQRPICGKHTRQGASGPTCVTCAKQELREEGRRQRVGGRRYGRYDHYDDDDPYFYSGYRYRSYGYYGGGYWGYRSYHHASHGDDADLTDADAAALGAEGAEAFETDMSES